MRWLRPWVIFAGCVLVVVLLDWAEPVLLPVAGALLLTFLLNPWVNGLQRWIRRGPAVVLVVTVTIGAMTLLGWGLARQMTSLATDLPRYRENIRQKIVDVPTRAAAAPSSASSRRSRRSRKTSRRTSGARTVRPESRRRS